MKTAEETERRMIDEIDRTMRRLHEGGAIDEVAMRRYVATGSENSESSVPADVKALREREGASRADLAYSLGVSPETVAQWERGKRKPSGPALKLLSLARANGLKSIA